MTLSFTKLPWYAQLGVFLAVAIGLSGAFYYYYDMQAQAEILTRQKNLAKLKSDIAKGQSTARQLPEFRAQVNDLEARLTSLRAVLPEEKDAADLLRRLQTVATQSNLDIKAFKPSTTVSKQLHVEWPISLQLEGTYHNLAIFFDRVGKFSRIINITGVDIKGRDKPGPTQGTISATCIATTFVLLDKPAAPAGGRGGRGAAETPAAKGN